jgi:NTP pyrophosphatase (non-canonical NTP hydrolase)
MNNNEAELDEVSRLQEKVQKFEKAHGFDQQSALVKCLLLGEEVGELFKAVRSASGVGVDSASATKAVGEELADVLIFLLAIANRFELKLGAEANAKLERNSTRTWE